MKRTREDFTPVKSFVHGYLKAEKVTECREFFKFIDELEKEYDKENGIGFFANREWFMRAFMEKRLYSLHMKENDSMFKHHAQQDPLFISNSFYVLPCLCVVTKERRDTVEILWTAKRARNNGFATALLEELGARYVIGILPDGDETFWQYRDCDVIHQIKPSFQSISVWPPLYHNDDDDDDDETSLDPLEDSSEEEDYTKSDSLVDVMIYKSWLIGDLLDNISDVQQYISSLLRLVYYNNVSFKPIDPSFWTSVYGVMSQKRIEAQEFKADLYQRRILDHNEYYGQFTKDVDNIVRNKTMLISRPYHLVQHRYDTLKSIAARYNIHFHAEPCRYRNNDNAWLIIIMDSGINQEKAISFARTIDYENAL